MDKTRFLQIIRWGGAIALLLSACGMPIEIGGQPAVIGFSTDYEPSTSDSQTYTTNQDQSANEPTGVQEIQVDNVRVDLGVGSPVPVMVEISGTWPGPCSQLAEIKQTAGEETFDIYLLATPDGPDCPLDQQGLLLEINIPLNMAGKQTGTYRVNVNGKETSFDWSGSLSK